VSVAGSSSGSTAWCDDVPSLASVFDPNINVAVLRRTPRPEVERFVCETLLPRDRDWRVAVDPTLPALDTLAPGEGDAGARVAFLRDLAALIDLFAALTESERVGVRLAATGASMCPRFHVDRVELRLVTTYLGPCTEWLDADAVDLRFLGHGSNGLADERSGLLLPGATVHAMRPFDVGVLKGTAWPGNELRGAVHRSPAMHGARRVVLTLDAL
jgi:hypothetical protein